MKWFRELSKMCLNLVMVSFAIFIFGFATNPSWRWEFLVIGGVFAAFFTFLSWFFWKRGEDGE